MDTRADHDILSRARNRHYFLLVLSLLTLYNAVAVPVRSNHGQVVAALGVQGPAHRFDHAARVQARPVLHREAEALSRQLVGLPDIINYRKVENV